MPKSTQQMATAVHGAASRLVIVLQDASVEPTAVSLHAVTSACIGRHAAYRLR